MAYAQRVRELFPRIIAGTTALDLDALAEDVCTSLDDFPLTTGVLGSVIPPRAFLSNAPEPFSVRRGVLLRGAPHEYFFAIRVVFLGEGGNPIPSPDLSFPAFVITSEGRKPQKRLAPPD